MKKITTMLLPALVFSSVYTGAAGTVAYAQTTEAHNKSLVFDHVNVVDVEAGQLQTDMTVVVKNNKITDVGKSGEVNQPKEATKIDGTGKYLMPGMWDMHTHIKHEKDFVYPMSLANGVTGLRDMGSYLENLTLWQRDAEEGKLMPHIYSAGMMIESHVSAFDFRFKVSNAQEGRHAVQELAKRNADFVKTYENLTREEYFAIADEAKKLGLPLAGHVPYGVSYEEASNAGQRSLEHLYGYFLNTSYKKKTYMDIFGLDREKEISWLGAYKNAEAVNEYSEEEAKKLFSLFAKNQTYIVPTFFAHAVIVDSQTIDYSKYDVYTKYIPADTLEMWKFLVSPEGYPGLDDGKLVPAISTWHNRNYSVVYDMQKAGVPLLIGTDFMFPVVPYIVPGFTLHDELEEYVKAGLTPAEALRTATINPAKFMEKEDQFGSVEKGKEADLVLLEANPLADITNTTKIDSVIIGGKVLDKEDRQAMLDELVGKELYKPKYIHVRQIEQHDVKIGWDGKTQEVTLKKGDDTLVLTIDSNMAKLNGNKMALANKIQLIDGKTMAPADMLDGLLDLKLK